MTTAGTDLVPVIKSTQVVSATEVTTHKATHDKAVKRYYEYQAVGQALRTQIIESIEAKYLNTLHNVDIDMIKISLLQNLCIITHNNKMDI